MFSKFNKQIDAIFLDTESSNFHTDANVNIILSPSLYWVKKVTLPVQKVKDVKPLLKSIFEDILPDGVYSYSAYKHGSSFFVFAYEDKKILKLIESKGLKSSQINHIYFAQSELSNINGAMKINTTQSIYVKDDIVVLLPCCWIKESGKLDISTIKLSKHHINIQQYTNFIDEKSLYKIIGLSLVFTLLLLTEYILTLQNIDKISAKKDNIFSSYSLKPTMIQNRSLLKKYEKIDAKQINLRKYIADILSLNLLNNVKLKLLTSDEKKLTVIFSGIDDKASTQIKKQLKNHKYTSKLKSNFLTLEFKL